MAFFQFFSYSLWHQALNYMTLVNMWCGCHNTEHIISDLFGVEPEELLIKLVWNLSYLFDIASIL